MTTTIGKEIKFHFHPYKYEDAGHVVEKDDSEGLKRRYLTGISSGIKIDAHGERMTEKCIRSFMDQSNSGDVLLYPDKHGISASEDIGILTKAEVLLNGDWYTEYRLYDEHDEVGSIKLEKAETIWKQMKGLPPYNKPRQKGFSIEGIIPDEALLYSGEEIKKGVLDNVELEGVILVPRPAYKDSISTAIYKALGETSPERTDSLQSAMRENIELDEIQDKYYRLKWQYQDALEEIIEKIMRKKNTNKREELEIIFEEYKEMFINLILQSERIFAGEQDSEEDIQGSLEPYGMIGKSETNPKLDLYKSLLSSLKDFTKMLEA